MDGLLSGQELEVVQGGLHKLCSSAFKILFPLGLISLLNADTFQDLSVWIRYSKINHSRFDWLQVLQQSSCVCLPNDGIPGMVPQPSIFISFLYFCSAVNQPLDLIHAKEVL